MNDELLLALDAGTQSLRAILFDPDGTLVARAHVPLPAPDSPVDGWAERDAEHFWEATCRACAELWTHPDVSPDAVAAVAVTTQRGSIVPVDEEGAPLRPAILWMDRRRTEGLELPGGLWGLAFKLARLEETIGYFQAEAEANWIERNEPDVWARTDRMLLISGFLTRRLVGRFVDSAAAQVGYLPFDFKRHRWAGRRDWKWDIGPIEPRHLPELVPPGDELGRITASASEATGIPEGTPMIAAGADKACEVLGSGVLGPAIGSLSYGTAATVNVISDRYREVIRFVPPYPAAIPDHYALEIQISSGYWMVSWFKAQFGHPEVERADSLDVAPEALFEELVESVPPGALGLILQPYWFPGIRHPGPEARGAVIGFGGAHTRAHLYRAIIEGVAFALREGSEQIVRSTGVPLVELRVSGGGSQSDAAMQITADIFGLSATRPHVYEASGLGAAIDAAVGVGIHPSFAGAVAAMTHRGDSFEPDPARHALYEELYQAAYLPLYERLAPIYHRLRRITGYPSPVE